LTFKDLYLKTFGRKRFAIYEKVKLYILRA